MFFYRDLSCSSCISTRRRRHRHYQVERVKYRTNIALLCSQVWAIFSSLLLTPLTFVLFILSCMIHLILSTVRSGFASLVPGVADMPKAVSSPAALHMLS